MYIFEVKNLSKSYIDAGLENVIFNNINLKIEEGKSVLLLGNSGCGKSTFLQIAGLIQAPTSGSVFIDNEDCSFKKISEKKKNYILKKNIGFIYQFHYLFNDFTAFENLIIPQIICGIDRKTAENKANEMLNKLNMSNRRNTMPNELSGGERQRIAIARAIIKQPRIILADEPTGNLDYDMSNLVVDEMLKIVKENSISLLMVSHNREFKNKFDHTYELTNNKLVMV